MPSSRIAAIASHLPERVLHNDELAQLYRGWTSAKIHSKTGIRSRRVAAEGETAGDLAFHAASRLFSEYGIARETVDFLILCTQGSDYFLPTTACLLQHRLGLRKSVGALDVNLGCSGFVYCLALANGLIASGAASRVLILTADTYSRFIHPGDKSVRTLFGDGATATVIDSVDDGGAPDVQLSSIGPFVFGTDGAGAGSLIVATGGMRESRSETSAVVAVDASENTRSRDDLFMDGAAVMAFTLSEVPAACAQLAARSGIGLHEFDLVVFHQANRYLLETLRRKIGFAPERFVIDLEDTGNTVSSSIPMALAPYLGVAAGAGIRRVLLAGFGVGYSWAAAVVHL